MRPIKVFLSYPNERVDQAYKIHAFIKSLGISGWFDKETLIGGQDWDRERGKAQREADLTILVCSPETVSRGGVIQREVKDALDRCRDMPFGRICLIPVRTDDISLPEELSRYHYIDLFRSDWEFQLARSIELKYEDSDAEKPP
jgi:hypothetical protein